MLIGLVVGVLGVGMVAVPSEAGSRRTGATANNAYSWNDYRAVVRPAGFTAPRGAKVTSTVTVKQGERTVVSGVKEARLRPGRYTVYSTYKYRARQSYRAQRWVPAKVAYCEVATSSYEPATWVEDEWGLNYMESDSSGENAYGNYTYTGTCWDVDHKKVSTAAKWYYYQVVEPGDAIWDPCADPACGQALKGKQQESYTAYRYGSTQTATRHRTHVVSKVVNTPTMTMREYDELRMGDSLAEVRRIVGSKGKLDYRSKEWSRYVWRNTAGGFTEVWFGQWGMYDAYWSAW